MTERQESPTTFLWVIRGLTTVFLIGYLIDIFLAMFVGEYYPSGNIAEDIAAIVLLLFFGFGYYLMWIRKEIIAGIVFILWYAALWPAELLIGGETFDDSPVPGILMLILGILFLVYRWGAAKKRVAGTARVEK